VCIVADGPLWELSFQALQTPANKFLQELYAIYYTPSLQVLREMRKRAMSLSASPISEKGQSDSVLRPEMYAIGTPTIGGEGLARVRTLRNTPFVPLIRLGNGD
jgi:CHAT domain